MYYGRSVDFESDNLTIDIVNDGAVSAGNVYSQPKNTGVLYNAYLIKPNFKANEKILHFFTTSIFKSIKPKFGYENKAGWEKVKKEKIKLPIANGKIDFDYMTGLITELESENIKKLENYLNENELKDYHLNENEKRALENFKTGNVKFKEFKIDDLFTINTYKKRFDANKVNISKKGKPYVVRTSINNGVRGYINEDEQFLNDANTISFGQDTATMFYQEKPYFTGDKIKIVKSRDNFFNKRNALFFIATMTKSFSSFSWGGSSFNVNIIKEQPIKIPIINKKPDYETMETIISAINKLVIKDVVIYLKRKKKELNRIDENANA